MLPQIVEFKFIESEFIDDNFIECPLLSMAEQIEYLKDRNSKK
jgi:hypothetical protein